MNMLRRKLMILRLMLFRNGYRRAEYLRKVKMFHKQGEHCFFTPYNFGTEPYLLSFGDNVYVASGVRFVNHDIAAKMFQHMDPQGRYTSRVGKIEVGNNVFIGAGATILYDVKIGDNVIVAAGALVNADLPESGIYGGVPARKIGDFQDYMAKSRAYSQEVPWNDGEELAVRKQKQIGHFFGGQQD